MGKQRGAKRNFKTLVSGISKDRKEPEFEQKADFEYRCSAMCKSRCPEHDMKLADDFLSDLSRYVKLFIGKPADLPDQDKLLVFEVFSDEDAHSVPFRAFAFWPIHGAAYMGSAPSFTFTKLVPLSPIPSHSTLIGLRLRISYADHIHSE